MKFCSWRYAMVAIALTSLSEPSISAEKTTYKMPRVSTAPTIDGTLGENEWANASQIQLKYDINPGENSPAPVETTAYIMEDGEFIYVAFDAKDPNPEQIKAYYRDRDEIFQDDFVGFIIDTFNAERRGFEFFVNPLGAQADLTRDDTRFNEDSSWNTLWESAGKLYEDGYRVEMAIPYRSIRFPSNLAKQTWSIQFLRIYPRDSRHVISNNQYDRNINCEICQYDKIEGFANLEASNALELTPTLTVSRGETRDPLSTQQWTENNDEDAGLDIRWAITEDWVANATINPDFSQIEADAAQLNVNTTDALFLREARPFFLEGRDYFDSFNNLIHTRNIADPEYGVKVTGKSNSMTHAFLVAQDEQTSFLIPQALGSSLVQFENMASEVAIGRVQKDLGDKDTLGFTFTHRNGYDYKNQVVSLDSRYHLTEADYFRVQWMQSDTDNPDEITDPNSDNYQSGQKASASDDAYTISYRHNKRDYLVRADYQSFGTDFRADMGFIGRVDYEKLIIGGQYRWFGDNGCKWTRWSIFGDWDETKRKSDGQKLEEEFEIHGSISGPKQFHTNFGYGTRKRYHEGTDGNNNQRSETFEEDFYMIWAEFRPFKDLWIGNFVRVGDQLDFSNFEVGKITFFEPHINWQIGQHFSLRYDGVLYDLKVDPSANFAGEHYKVDIANLRAAYQFDLRSRLRLTTQYSDIKLKQDGYRSKTLSWQLLYSYKVNPQSLIFIGYSSQGYEEDPLDNITDTDRTLFAKFSYVWQS